MSERRFLVSCALFSVVAGFTASAISQQESWTLDAPSGRLRSVSAARMSPQQDGQRSLAEELRAATSQPFQAFCSVCHGETGQGDGPLAELLDPKPVDFTLGRPVISDRIGALASDERRLRIVREGMPGSAMPSFRDYGEPMMRIASASVHKLAVTRKAHALRRAAIEAGGQPKAEELRGAAEASFVGGESVEIPDFRGFEFDLDRGRQLYQLSCLPCHGQNGAGYDGLFVDAKGHSISSRDLRRGYYRGGTSARDIFTRIRVGVPYSGMPPVSKKVMGDEDAMHLTGYVQSLLRQHFGTVQPIPWEGLQKEPNYFVARVSEVPTDPGDALWAEAEVERPTLSHFDRRGYLTGSGLELRMLHDREKIAIRVRWEDAPGPAGMHAFGDGVALQLSAQPSPSFFLEARFPGQRFTDLGPAWFWSSRLGAFRAFPEYSPGKLHQLHRQRLAEDGSGPNVVAKKEGRHYAVVFVRTLDPRAGSQESKPGDEVSLSPLLEVQLQVQCFDAQARPGLRGLAFSHWGRIRLDP
jgi:mono/diheme cytochrome c family protein